VKKSQWATPAGVDHDYNYLRSVERSIGDAGQDAQTRGIGVAAPAFKGTAKAWQPDSALMKYLNLNRITVDHAPLGMSRQKNNQTRISKKGRVTWSVEWIDADSTRYLQNECWESMPVGELFAMHKATLRNATERRSNKVSGSNPSGGHVRKRRQIANGPQCEADEQFLRQQSNHLQHVANPDLSGAVDSGDGDMGKTVQTEILDGTEEDPPLFEPHIAAEDESNQFNETDNAEDSDSSMSPVQIITEAQEDTALEPASNTGKEASDHTEQALQAPTRIHYYLHKTGTPSKHRILILLDPSATLTDALRGQIVQEYPTIYVLHVPPTALPSGFILGERYTRTFKPATDTKPAEANYGHRSEMQPVSAESKQIDANSILDMLKRDVTV